MRSQAILQENNQRTQREDSNSFPLLYTQTRTSNKETSRQDRQDSQTRQRINAQILLNATQTHNIKSAQRVFDYQEKDDIEYSVTRYRNASKVEIKKKSNKVNTIARPRADRKEITDFSYRSRQGLKNVVNKLDRAELDENEIIFVTLTYGSDTEKLRQLTAEDYKKHIKAFTRALINKYKDFDIFGITRFEFQKRLVGHFHLVIYNVAFIHYNVINELWCNVIKQDARTDVQKASDYEAVENYVSKVMCYVAKQETDEDVVEYLRKFKIGRHWSTFNNKILKTYINEENTKLQKDEHIKAQRVTRKIQKANNRKKLQKIEKINQQIRQDNQSRSAADQKHELSTSFLRKRFTILKKSSKWHSTADSLTNHLYMKNEDLDRLLAYATDNRMIAWHLVDRDEIKVIEDSQKRRLETS